MSFAHPVLITAELQPQTSIINAEETVGVLSYGLWYDGGNLMSQYSNVLRRTPAVTVTIELDPIRQDIQLLEVALLPNV
jgi:hypothetical protein